MRPGRRRFEPGGERRQTVLRFLLRPRGDSVADRTRIKHSPARVDLNQRRFASHVPTDAASEGLPLSSASMAPTGRRHGDRQPNRRGVALDTSRRVGVCGQTVGGARQCAALKIVENGTLGTFRSTSMNASTAKRSSAPRANKGILETTGLLSGLWYYAVPGHRLRRGQMVRRTLLGEPVLIGRDNELRVFAIHDICPHRGIPLSHGRYDGNEVECCYHG